jgi:hypothetical protein
MRAYLLPVLAIALLATGCAHMGFTEARARRYCWAAEDGAWRFLSAPPADADAMVAIAKPILATPYSGDRIRLYWFDNTAGDVLLCRTYLEGITDTHGCAATTWKFHRGANGWQQEGGEVITVCGRD